MSQLHTEGQNATVLVVDDSIDELHLITDILQNQGYQVRGMAHGALAIKSAQTDPPDIILLDIIMPDIDGYAVCAALRAEEHTRDIPIIFISGLNDVSDRVRGLEIGGVDYITRPFHAEEVLARVATHLALRQIKRQMQEQNNLLQQKIRERQHVEKRLRENQHFINRITETMPALVYIYDLHECQTVYTNRQSITLFSCLEEPADEQTSAALQHLIHPDDLPRVLAHIQQFNTASDAARLECTYRVRHPDDTWHWLHQHDMVFTRTPDARPLQIIGSSIDITEQRQTVEFVRQQEKALAMLRKRDRLTRELHTMLSQALGTIATHNQSAHDLLQNQHIAPALSHLSDAITMTRQAQTNIQDFIVGTRVHSGPQDTQQEQPGFATALREHCRWLQHLYGFTTTLHIPDILEEVTLSPLTEMHLLHIVQGALSNVRKHAGVAAAQVTLWLQDTWVCVQVTDQGSGFDPNHSLASPDDTGYPGYGLQRMREHVDEIGGHLQVESMVGSGSRITAWVPVYAETSLSALDMRLLLVDDNQLFLEGLRNLLEAHSLTIVGTASSGEEALAQARQLQPDVILMDIEMPGMNGLETTRRIRAELPDIQIVMLTVADNDETLFEAIKIGAIGYLTKNITAEEIYQVLFDLARGGTPLSPGLARRILREFADRDPVESEQTTDTLNTARLTPRQREILTLVVQGHTYKQIGHMLNYSESTIKYHMGNILKNLHLENRADAVAYVRRQMASGLWTRPPDE